jgi:hypothetical protein
LSTNLAFIQAALQQLSEFLEQYGLGLPANQPAPDLAPIMQTLDRAGQALQELPARSDLDPVSIAAIDEYVEKLKQLEITLTKLGPQLESRRDEIRGRLARVRAASSWAGSLKQTR